MIVSKYFSSEFNRQIRSLYNKEMKTKIVLFVKDKKIIDIEYNDDNSLQINESDELYNEAIYIDNPFVMDSVKSFPVYYSFRRIQYGHNEKLINKLSNDNVRQSIIEEVMSKQNYEIIIKRIQNIINGEFIYDDEDLMFVEKNTNIKVGLSNLSTGIKAFSILLKLIENGEIKENGVLILDEPEIHLHPKWQLKFAEILVLMQKELNLHILLNSHSPYFIQAIEVSSAKYEIADKCKYYFSYLEDNCAMFEDVTTNISKIYRILSEPLIELTKEIYSDGEI